MQISSTLPTLSTQAAAMHVGRLCRCLRRQVGKSAAEATEFCCRQEWRVFLAIASDSGQGSTYEKEQQSQPRFDASKRGTLASTTRGRGPKRYCCSCLWHLGRTRNFPPFGCWSRCRPSCCCVDIRWRMIVPSLSLSKHHPSSLGPMGRRERSKWGKS